ncbi:MAG: hypothetical protein IVW55_14010 [Chloroflexi bacterium]|nr:hypothetical protein [Chloroflexota bacterium]
MDDFLNGITLLGIPALVLVPLLVQGIKQLGLPGRYAGVAALIIGLSVAGLAEVITAWPTVTPLVRFLVAGILLGLAPIGAYSQYKAARKG